MPEKGSRRLIARAHVLHGDCAPVLAQQQLAPAAVHKLRVAVKTLRAQWQLLKPFLPDGRADAAGRDIGRAARQLAGARDQHVRIQTLDACIRKAEESERTALRRAREQLVAQPPGAAKEPTVTAEVASRFAQDRERWHELDVALGKRELVRDGCGRLYRKARKRFQSAAASGDAEEWHRLRRWTKYLALALPAVSDADTARAAAKRFAGLAAKLGDVHDLDELARGLGALPGAEAAPIRQATALVEQRAEALRSKCHRKAGKLFKAGPRAATKGNFAVIG